MKIKIGSRKSELAVKQTEAVMKRLSSEFPEDTFELVTISTQGDKRLDRTLQSFEGKGIFIKEIETALLNGEIDMAVHSAKDMPTDLPPSLTIGAALLRKDRSDVLAYFNDTNNFRIIGSGSPRRIAQAKKLFPDAEFKSIRGNIGTRLEKVRSGEYDAVIMARTALTRLNIEDVKILPLGDDFICAPGQGIIAVETVSGRMDKYTEAINDKKVMTELLAERAFLKYTGGGCHIPCGASAVCEGNKITMRTFFGDSKSDIRLEMTGSAPVALGRKMARRTLELLEEI